ncbi:MAG: PTS sugar transporter subunit IIA [Deltaproteobacteria bacterium]
MIGIVIITHGKLAEEFVEVARDIVGQTKGVIPVCIERRDAVEEVRKEIEKAIKDLDEGDGVILFTDMFGGTPSNLGLSFLDEGRTEVIGGVNLPMVIKASMSREGRALKELASFIKEYGQNSISLASEILTMKSAKR